jgi:hypothetical protein
MITMGLPSPVNYRAVASERKEKVNGVYCPLFASAACRSHTAAVKADHDHVHEDADVNVNVGVDVVVNVDVGVDVVVNVDVIVIGFFWLRPSHAP